MPRDNKDSADVLSTLLPISPAIKHIETYAEYFALYYVLKCLKNEELFKALCSDRNRSLKNPNDRQVNALKHYAAAVDAFGGIEDEASSDTFIKSTASWREYWVDEFLKIKL